MLSRVIMPVLGGLVPFGFLIGIALSVYTAATALQSIDQQQNLALLDQGVEGPTVTQSIDASI